MHRKILIHFAASHFICCTFNLQPYAYSWLHRYLSNGSMSLDVSVCLVSLPIEKSVTWPPTSPLRGLYGFFSENAPRWKCRVLYCRFLFYSLGKKKMFWDFSYFWRGPKESNWCWHEEGGGRIRGMVTEGQWHRGDEYLSRVTATTQRKNVSVGHHSHCLRSPAGYRSIIVSLQ